MVHHLPILLLLGSLNHWEDARVRRKEKEAERQQKIKEIKAAPVPQCIALGHGFSEFETYRVLHFGS